MTNFPAVGSPPFINRMLSIPEWQTYVANYGFGSVPPSRVVLHHTYIPNLDQWRGLASMQGMQKFYAGKGWTAAPHIYVGPDGVWLATPMKDVGIHAGVGNSGRANGKFWYSIGIEMVGYYDKVRPSGAVWEGTKAVMGGLSKRLGIPPRQLISFHRDYTNQKSCPGWAVTKDWVFAEVEAWLNNQAPPPPPPGPVQIGSPTPEVESLIELLMDESYKRRGEGYNSTWAFHQHAVQNNLGFPVGKSARLDLDGKSYGYQPFARDTLFNEIPNWGEVQRLSDLLGGSIPAGGLGRALLDATYRAAGATFHADWAFHQYAVASKLGPPLAESKTITVDGAKYACQVYALDTIYNLVPNWSDIRRVSALAGASDPAQARLRDALLAETYRPAGATYHADWAFHQLARTWNLGAPLSDSYRVASGAAQYAVQVYATDTLYNVVPHWADVKRVGDLIGPRPGAVSFGLEEEELSFAAGTQLEPAPAPHHIVTYAVPMSGPTAYGSRSGSRIRLVVLHGDPGPAERTLALMTTPGSRAMPHFYVTAEGEIYRLVDDEHATFHAGMALWNGRKRNINRISLSVVVERGYSKRQLAALAWLANVLCARYDLPAEAVVRWSDLSPRRGDDPAEFPWDAFAAQLAVGVEGER